MENVSSSNGLEKCPKLRFPGFANPWKTTQLCNLFSKNTQKNSKGTVTNVISNSAKNGLIPQKDYFDKDIANADNIARYYIISKNDFVYNPRKSMDAPYGPISRYTYDEDGIVSPLYLCFRSNQDVNPEYFERFFKSSVWHRYIYMSGDSGARHDRVSIKDETFFEMPIHMPSNEEQKKIAAFLSLIEQKIECQFALIENLKKYKRGLLDKLLEDNSTDANWRIVMLQDVATGFDYGMNSAATIFDGVHKYIRITDIDDDSRQYLSDDIVSPSDTPEEKYKVNINDILFARTGASVGKSYLYTPEDGELYFAGFLIRVSVKSEFDNYFVYLNTLTSKYEKWLRLESMRSGQPGVNAEQYRNYAFRCPDYETQVKIANIIKCIDLKIAKERKSLAKLYSLKNGLLQQLFI